MRFVLAGDFSRYIKRRGLTGSNFACRSNCRASYNSRAAGFDGAFPRGKSDQKPIVQGETFFSLRTSSRYSDGDGKHDDGGTNLYPVRNAACKLLQKMVRKKNRPTGEYTARLEDLPRRKI